MLNVKLYSTQTSQYIPFIFLGSLILLIQIFLNLSVIFDDHIDNTTFSVFGISLDNLSNIDIFGQGLYNYFLITFLIAGLILLVAMIGAIVLTLNFRSQRKTELAGRQLSRSDNFLAFFN